MIMYHRHSNENIRQSRPFDYDRSSTNSTTYQDRLPIRPDERHHHHHHHNHHHPTGSTAAAAAAAPSSTATAASHPHHNQAHPHPQFEQRRYPSSTYHHHHQTSSTRIHQNIPGTADHRFPSPSTDRLSRSQPNSAPRRIDYPERTIQARQMTTAQNNHSNGSFEDSRRTYEHNRSSTTTNNNNPSSNKAYDDHPSSNNHNNHTSTTTPINSSNTHHIHRRSDEFPASRSARYNPYPPSGPRADSHLPPSIGRISNGVTGHAAYHSSSSGPPAYDERIPASRSHEHIPQRTYDPNSQFNHGPPKDKSPPSQSVIFMGLPIHTDEANLRAFLEESGASVDSVTIIYDRITGQSKRYGFARFLSVEHARAFVEPAFPMVVWKEPSGSRFDRSGDGLKVKIDYSQKEKVPFEVRQRERELAPRSTPATPFISEIPNQSTYSYKSSSESSLTTVINDGARDIGGTPTSILLLRGLDPLSTEQEIAQHLQHIPDPSQTVLPESIRKVMLIKDRATRSSWGYAFVQFAEVQVAVKALSLLLNTSLFPRGFQIRSRTITVTFAHEHSFHPIYTPSDWSFRGASGQELAYWDDKAYAALYISPIAEPDRSPSTSSKTKAPTESKQAEEASNGRHEETDVDEVLTSIDPESERNSTKKEISIDQENSFKHQAKSDTLNNREANTGDRLTMESQTSEDPKNENLKAELNTQADLINPGEGGSQQIENMNSKPKGAEIKTEKKKNGVEPIATKKMVANIQKWQSKHQEIASAGTSEEEKSHLTIAPEHLVVDEDDFSDFNRLTCVLCQRQFKSPEDLQRHNNLSNLHKTNLQNEKLKKIARAKKAASLAKKLNNPGAAVPAPNAATTSATAEGSGAKYTDRAAARREAYGQPDAPNADKHEAKKARYEPAPAPAVPAAQPDKEGIQATNVGSKMLEKMGWQKGEGLGNGNGRVDPVQAAQYSKGVGLGASSSVPVGQYEDSKKGFLDQVKDKTVDRFNQDQS
ncbi:hypothetical protein PGTUg99_016329 [Puccinia graminis f. sp. tritici]|uniref:RNA-binding protein n=1 Tax=Puccinia graminis f. sp. tritici TaxID=56615 RepID=A0A5B0R7A1_PUCGR|nr:hypothetical protein PGTUg99_016329 [Puccinia graminis f. sp. tritici]